MEKRGSASFLRYLESVNIPVVCVGEGERLCILKKVFCAS